MRVQRIKLKFTTYNISGNAGSVFTSINNILRNSLGSQLLYIWIYWDLFRLLLAWLRRWFILYVCTCIFLCICGFVMHLYACAVNTLCPQNTSFNEHNNVQIQLWTTEKICWKIDIREKLLSLQIKWNF